MGRAILPYSSKREQTEYKNVLGLFYPLLTADSNDKELLTKNMKVSLPIPPNYVSREIEQ